SADRRGVQRCREARRRFRPAGTGQDFGGCRSWFCAERYRADRSWFASQRGTATRGRRPPPGRNQAAARELEPIGGGFSGASPGQSRGSGGGNGLGPRGSIAGDVAEQPANGRRPAAQATAEG